MTETPVIINTCCTRCRPYQHIPDNEDDGSQLRDFCVRVGGMLGITLFSAAAFCGLIYAGTHAIVDPNRHWNGTMFNVSL